MATIKGTLKHGFKVGDATHCDYTLREVIAGDVIEANEESEKLVIFPNAEGKTEPQFVPSPTLVGANVLRRQIMHFGPVSGPFTLDDIKKLHPEDYKQLSDDAEQLEEVIVTEASKEVAQRGRADSDGGGD